MKVQAEEVPEAEAGRPPDPPEGGVGDIVGHGDEDEIEVEGEGAPVRKAKVGTLRPKQRLLCICACIATEIRISKHASAPR